MCVTCAMHCTGRARAGTWALHAHRSAHGARTGTLHGHCMCIHGICISQGNDRRIGICICSRMRCSFRKMSSHVESNQRVPMLTRLPGMLWVCVDIAICRVSSGISLRHGVWHANVGAFDLRTACDECHEDLRRGDQLYSCAT